jgi:hypothetical protein
MLVPGIGSYAPWLITSAFPAFLALPSFFVGPFSRSITSSASASGSWYICCCPTVAFRRLSSRSGRAVSISFLAIALSFSLASSPLASFDRSTRRLRMATEASRCLGTASTSLAIARFPPHPLHQRLRAHRLRQRNSQDVRYHPMHCGAHSLARIAQRKSAPPSQARLSRLTLCSPNEDFWGLKRGSNEPNGPGAHLVAILCYTILVRSPAASFAKGQRGPYRRPLKSSFGEHKLDKHS